MQTSWGANSGLELQLTRDPKSTLAVNLIYDAKVSPLSLIWLRSQTPQLTFPLCPLGIADTLWAANQKEHRMQGVLLDEPKLRPKPNESTEVYVLLSFSYLLSMSSFLYVFHV